MMVLYVGMDELDVADTRQPCAKGNGAGRDDQAPFAIELRCYSGLVSYTQGGCNI